MFHFGMTKLCIISGYISLTQQLFIVHYLCLASFLQRKYIIKSWVFFIISIQRTNSKHEDIMLTLTLLECLY